MSAGANAFFETVWRSSNGLLERGHVHRVGINLAGERATLQFGSQDLLQRFLPGLHHALAPPSDEGLDMRIVMGGTHHPLPDAPAWLTPHLLLAGRGPNMVVDGLLISFDHALGALLMLDATGKRAICWLREEVRLPAWERAAPLRVLIGMWLSVHGVALVHAACVGVDSNNTVLLVGRGGSGKSTTALAALLSGQVFLGDDYVGVSIGPVGSVHAHALYGSAKATPRTLQLLPQLHCWQAPDGEVDGEKVVLYLPASAAIVCSATVRAVVHCCVAPHVAALLTRTRPAIVFNELISTNSVQLASALPLLTQTVAHLVRALPCYQLNLRPDMQSAPAQLRELMERHGQ